MTAQAHKMTYQDLANRIREEAQRIPLGGTIRVSGAEPMSGYNLAEHVARIIEKCGGGHEFYERLCDQPPNPQ